MNKTRSEIILNYCDAKRQFDYFNLNKQVDLSDINFSLLKIKHEIIPDLLNNVYKLEKEDSDYVVLGFNDGAIDSNWRPIDVHLVLINLETFNYKFKKLPVSIFYSYKIEVYNFLKSEYNDLYSTEKSN